MNIETVITVTHFSVSVKQLIGFLRACIDFPRTCFWAAGTSSPRLLPNFSSIWLPASLLLGSRHLFSTLAAQLLEYLLVLWAAPLRWWTWLPNYFLAGSFLLVLWAAATLLALVLPIKLPRGAELGCPLNFLAGSFLLVLWAAATLLALVLPINFLAVVFSGLFWAASPWYWTLLPNPPSSINSPSNFLHI